MNNLPNERVEREIIKALSPKSAYFGAAVTTTFKNNGWRISYGAAKWVKEIIELAYEADRRVAVLEAKLAKLNGAKQ